MRKLLSLVAGSIIGGLVALAWAVPGQARIIRPIVPDLSPPIKVHFHRTAGVPEFRELDVKVDSTNLRSWERRSLRELLQKARFFELKSSVVEVPIFVPDPPAEYTITVETEGRKHTVRWNTRRDELRPLVDWLTGRPGVIEPLQIHPIGPPVARCLLPDQVTVTMTGKLQLVIRGLEELAIWPPKRHPHPEITAFWQVVVNGKTYHLDLSKSKDVQELVNKLNGQVVELNGLLVGETVQVTGLKAAATAARQSVRVEIRGLLNYGELERFPPIPFWTVTAAGKTYHLSLGSAELQKRGRELSGQRVVLRGTLENDRVIVSDLVAAPLVRC
jgi:hypothetical protein